MNNYDRSYILPRHPGLWALWLTVAFLVALLAYCDHQAIGADMTVPTTPEKLRDFFLSQSTRDPFRPPGQQQPNPAARMPGVDQSTFEYLKGQEVVNDAKRRADQCAQACSDRGNRTNSDCHQRCLAEYKRIVEEFVKKRQGKR